MSGRLIAVVGASGVGKDSLIAALVAADPRLTALRRVVTRAPEAGGEPCDCVTEEVFAARRARGDFALSWGAHGLFYGIPTSGLDPVARGRDVLVNLSRSVLSDAARFAPLHVLWVSATPEVLAERLAARGRESTAEIARRIARPSPPRPEGIAITDIDNSGPLDAAADTALRALYRERV
ncbi:phosphonate metabolism protein/1,5-bisphosphokinase (PRPP-forming) PhnN [Rhodobacterales bacterium HKCCE2091]|nr:phosphonate metabolism protein/1,5-bisphosphokinase (PRPP-forming) PhnN [Rhodobacterales bacterium HKCCE2091]